MLKVLKHFIIFNLPIKNDNFKAYLSEYFVAKS